jgi:hypothetical protein
MLFDLTLLGFRRRAVWIKPMIQVCLHTIRHDPLLTSLSLQDPGLSQRPYIDDDIDGLGGEAAMGEEG